MEAGFTDQEYCDSSVQVAKDVFTELFRRLARQVQRIQTEAPKGNFSFYILQAYRSNSFMVVPSRRKLVHEDDCIVEKGALCIRPKTLLAYLQSHNCFLSLSKHQLGKQLRQEGVLPDCAEAKSASKRIHHGRFLALDLELLAKAAKRY